MVAGCICAAGGAGVECAEIVGGGDFGTAA